jgi:hypothetical protein
MQFKSVTGNSPPHKIVRKYLINIVMASAVQWRMYDDAMNRALAVLVRFQHKEPFSQHWGKGNTSSSDGLRVQVGVFKPLLFLFEIIGVVSYNITFLICLTDQNIFFWIIDASFFVL